MRNKVTENIVANLLCYLLDNHECQPLDERQLQEIGSKFLESDYNKSDAIEENLAEEVKKFIDWYSLATIERQSFKKAIRLMENLTATIDALDSENKTLRVRLESAQKQLEHE